MSGGWRYTPPANRKPDLSLWVVAIVVIVLAGSMKGCA